MPSNVRKLNYHSEECQEKIDEALLIMEGAVSRMAEATVENSHFTCFEEMDDPEEAVCNGIESWSLWDSVTNDIIYQEFQQGASVNQTEMSTKNLEAVVSNACAVETVEFVVSGPEDYYYTHTERNALYFVFGNKGATINDSFNAWPEGEYTVTANVKLQDNAGTKQATLTFTVDERC